MEYTYTHTFSLPVMENAVVTISQPQFFFSMFESYSEHLSTLHRDVYPRRCTFENSPVSVFLHRGRATT